jgi:hypothetical protein
MFLSIRDRIRPVHEDVVKDFDAMLARRPHRRAAPFERVTLEERDR